METTIYESYEQMSHAAGEIVGPSLTKNRTVYWGWPQGVPPWGCTRH